MCESPYAGEVDRNVEYACRLTLWCLKKGYAPMVSHLLYTRMLDDLIPEERKLGIEAGLAWRKVAKKAVFGIDYGWSGGMLAAKELYDNESIPYELVTIGENP